MTTKLSPGQPAPTFALKNQDNQKIALGDFLGRNVLVYFYPRAMTPGCTVQACDLSKNLAVFKQLNAEVIGISADMPEKLKQFDDKHRLGFALLSDPNHQVAEAYGVWAEKSLFGKKYHGIVRSAFLIDRQGKIQATWYKISPLTTVSKAKKALEKN